MDSYQYDLYAEKQKGEYQFRKRNIKIENRPKPYLGTLYKNRRLFIDTFKNFDDLKTFTVDKKLNSSTNLAKIQYLKEEDFSSPKQKYFLSKFEGEKEMEIEDLEAYITNFFL